MRLNFGNDRLCAQAEIHRTHVNLFCLGKQVVSECLCCGAKNAVVLKRDISSTENESQY